MPKRKRYTQPLITRAKRWRRVLRRRYKAKRRIPRLPITGFPSKKMVRLRYASEIELDATNAATDLYQYRLNSVYDPNYTGLGVQPTGTDEWFNVYNKCTVVGAKVVVRCMGPASQSNGIPGYWGIHISSDPADVGSNTTANELLMLGTPIAHFGPVNMGARFKNQLVRKWSAKKHFGKKDIIDEDNYSHLHNSNPAEPAFVTVWAHRLGSTDPGACFFMLTIDYICVFHDKKKLAGS